jgi:hypothetical protein
VPPRLVGLQDPLQRLRHRPTPFLPAAQAV